MEDILARKYTRQLLESLSETEVKLSERAMIRHISALRSNGAPARQFEVELCYIQDEINRRRSYMASED